MFKDKARIDQNQEARGMSSSIEASSEQTDDSFRNLSIKAVMFQSEATLKELRGWLKRIHSPGFWQSSPHG
jgi:hypothetical protein